MRIRIGLLTLLAGLAFASCYPTVPNCDDGVGEDCAEPDPTACPPCTLGSSELGDCCL
jgi:hypothetical protein